MQNFEEKNPKLAELIKQVANGKHLKLRSLYFPANKDIYGKVHWNPDQWIKITK